MVGPQLAGKKWIDLQDAGPKLLFLGCQGQQALPPSVFTGLGDFFEMELVGLHGPVDRAFGWKCYRTGRA